VGLALVLTLVINTVFFGWTIRLAWPWWEMILMPVWMTGSCLLAGWVPAARAASIPPAEAVRME
jgi:ABC-type lipoprotein release transport system permease subunit